MSNADANGWMPIETAPQGRCMMWVADAGIHWGACVFGNVYVFRDAREYRPDGYHGEWNVTHWQPIPNPPVQP